MARLIDRTFNPDEPVVARRHFVAAGRHFNIGDSFDWKRMAVNQRRVKQLYDAGKLMHRDLATAQRPAPDDKSKTVKETKPDSDASEAADTATEAAPLASTNDEPQDDLTDLSMKELREIADVEKAPTRVSRKEQREAIREHRRAQEE